jgi:hypothetical protein
MPNGPAWLMARNGERMVIDPLNGFSGVGALSYLDASEGFLHSSPAGTFGWGLMASISADGGRMLLDADRVLDAQFKIVGHIEVPPYPGASIADSLSQVMSPDGTRAYVLVFRGDDRTLPAPTVKPRVFVFDTSGDVGPTAAVPVLGFFELDDYPNCINDFTVCDRWPAAAISLDGGTLFFAGSEKLVIAPIPPEGTLSTASVGTPGDRTTIRATPWRLPSTTSR